MTKVSQHLPKIHDMRQMNVVDLAKTIKPLKKDELGEMIQVLLTLYTTTLEERDADQNIASVLRAQLDALQTEHAELQTSYTELIQHYGAQSDLLEEQTRINEQLRDAFNTHQRQAHALIGLAEEGVSIKHTPIKIRK